MFAKQVRSSEYSSHTRVRVQTVQLALRAVSQTFELDGDRNPCYQVGHQVFLLPIKRLLAGYRRADPPSEQKLAIPIAVIQHILNKATNQPTVRRLTIANLCTIAFFYLLRVGEYTDSGKHNTRTHPFRVGDVTFWKNHKIIDNRLALATLYQANAATLTITNQKNGNPNEPIHQEATNQQHCPVRALARHVHYILQNTADASTHLGTYWDCKGNPKILRSSVITATIKLAVTEMGLEANGIPPSSVSSHSIRAGGAMALHLAGVHSHLIQKMGRWSSDTFLTYIHAQISTLSTGLSSLMGASHEFHNIARPFSSRHPHHK